MELFLILYSQPSPLFILPPFFTRSDKPNNYAYTDKRYYLDKTDQTPDADDNIHNRTRSLRKGHFSTYVFSLTNELPTEPHEANIAIIKGKIAHFPQLQDDYDTVKKV